MGPKGDCVNSLHKQAHFSSSGRGFFLGVGSGGSIRPLARFQEPFAVLAVLLIAP